MRHLSNKEKKQLTEILPNGYSFEKKDDIIEDFPLIYRNDEKFLIITQNHKKKISEVIPHLRSLQGDEIKAVHIDIGAVPFLIKGADMMRPGIQHIDDNIKENDIILIQDEDHQKTLAIGKAVFSSEEMKSRTQGICVKVLHYMGDKFF